MNRRSLQQSRERGDMPGRISQGAERPFKLRSVRHFAGARGGSVAIMFAFMLMIVFGTVGASLDYGRAVTARAHTLQALDAAVLAAGRVLQITGDSDKAIAAARNYYEQAKSPLFTTDNTTFEWSSDGTTISGTTLAKMLSPFLSFLGTEELTVEVISRAVLAVDGNAGTNIEVSLMLDTTGSMSGDKMVDLKVAAKDMVDIVVWDDQSSYQSRVALVPFSEYVNVGSDYFRTVTGFDPSSSGDHSTCVNERISSTYRYTDDAPGSGKYFGGYAAGGYCKPRADNLLMPLSSDKDTLKSRIDDLRTTGYTAGHLGINWSWMTLSGKWRDIWPSGSAPGLDSDVGQNHTVTVAGQTLTVPKLRKIAVLMTDGEFNRQYNGDDTNTQAKALCDAMKAKGIEVYSVVFALQEGSTAHQTMSYCATSSSHFYDAEDGADLKSAFRDIALKIATLRLVE